MVAHALGVLTIIKNLRLSHPDIIQPWCDEYAGALCMFRKREDYINSLKQAGLDCSYFPELTKSVLIVHLDNIEAEIFFGEHHRLKFCTGPHYLGGFIGDKASKRGWLIDQTAV